MHSFIYDPFQEEAIRCIRGGVSAFVSAPTGSGKTVIAEVAVEEALKAGGMAPPPNFSAKGGSNLRLDGPNGPKSGGGVAIYTAPIKALSNQKFRDFHSRYGEKAGILTGDVTLNPEAPLLIMTTEIYRNSLFEGKGRFANCRWVIFDEVHYLDDRERGTVWEEALLLTPLQTEILALSATIPNARQLAAWIEKIHGREVKVILETHRPVPLKFAFQCQDELFRDLDSLKSKGYRGRERVGGQRPRPFRMRRSRGGRRFFKPGPVPFQGGEFHGRTNRSDHLLRQIQQAGHLPCLYFAFSRRRVEELAWEFAALNLLAPEGKAPLLEHFDRLCDKYQIRHERSATEMRQLIGQGVAYHHAGLLPTLKEVVEVLFSTRQIQVITTTETFALGVNMPAKSVVLDTLTRRADGPRSILRVRDLSQMAGRAGRRGMDEAGFVYLRVNPWEVPFTNLDHLIHGRPEEVSSRFSLTYATLLNLYRTHAQNLFPFYQKTLHAFQASSAYQREAFSLIERKLTLLKKLDYLRERPTPKGEFAASLYGYELLLSELFEGKVLETLDTTDLGILLLAMVYEPRRGAQPVRLPHRLRGLAEQAEQLLDRIHQEERRLRISPLTKRPAFHLSPAMERWTSGAGFEKTVEASGVEEGELIRYFRMTIQLCRGLAASPMAGRGLKEKALRLIEKINRDPVDAEAELRRSL